MTYTIGIDYGTDSVRALIVDTQTGEEIGTHVFYYPRWKEGKYCDPVKNQFRQHPLDYLEGLKVCIREALKKCPDGVAENVVGISVDTTGSTPVPVNREGTPLALLAGYEENPNAMFVLWKDHTAVLEADGINEFSRTWGGIDYTKFEGGVYSSEWFWAKVLHILRENKAVRKAAYSWVEHCDWMPALLTGCTKPENVVRSRCAAGHKAMWHEDFGGLPSENFLTGIDPLLSGLRERLYTDTTTSDISVGTLTEEWGSRLGLPTTVIVTAGAFDAHMGAVGGQISPGSLLKVMGTSTCDMIVSPPDEFKDTLVQGICGQVNGSIVPGMIGLEAGQSAFGDLFAWFKQLLIWPLRNIEDKDLLTSLTSPILKDLDEEAAKLSPEESGVLALDWLNGRRTPDADQTLKGAVMGLTLGSDAPRVYRSLVDAAAFGARRITERFEDNGVKIRDVIAVGGVAIKSPYVMQTVCDVMNKPIKVASELQTVALGAAIFAATAAGIYPSVEAAQKAMGSGFEKTYTPNPEAAAVYDKLYAKYLEFGGFIEKQTRK
ncbi:MAG: ribulokinase [Spirochaetales bacterium]|nr:ribulokinase [Spirochaetales bacterium]